MFQIRRNCFETNSSSTHCLAVPQESYITNIKYLKYLKGKKLRFNLGYFGRPLETIKVKPTDYLYTAILADLPFIGWQDGFSTDELAAIRENSEMPDIQKYCPKAVERLNKLKNILDKYNISNIDVLKVGHHGSKTSSGKVFIDGINPKYSIISVGKNNRYGHPNKEVLNNLDGSKIYRTDQDGSIMFKIKKNKLRIATYSP